VRACSDSAEACLHARSVQSKSRRVRVAAGESCYSGPQNVLDPGRLRAAHGVAQTGCPAGQLCSERLDALLVREGPHELVPDRGSPGAAEGLVREQPLRFRARRQVEHVPYVALVVAHHDQGVAPCEHRLSDVPDVGPARRGLRLVEETHEAVVLLERDRRAFEELVDEQVVVAVRDQHPDRPAACDAHPESRAVRGQGRHRRQDGTAERDLAGGEQSLRAPATLFQGQRAELRFEQRAQQGVLETGAGERRQPRRLDVGEGARRQERRHVAVPREPLDGRLCGEQRQGEERSERRDPGEQHSSRCHGDLLSVLYTATLTARTGPRERRALPDSRGATTVIFRPVRPPPRRTHR
jgi:hypothetical protein